MPQTPLSINTRTLKAGEVLLKPGDKITKVYVIQSGRLSLCQRKGEKLVEVALLRSPETIGDEAVFGPFPWTLTALAIRDTVIVEIPIEFLKEQLQGSSGNYKTLVRSFSDRMKTTFGELRTLQVNREIVPCPGDNTAKVFSVIFHTALAVGKKSDEEVVANWNELKKHAFEVFDEPVVRLEDAVNILVKLGYARLEGDSIRLTEMKQVEAFFEYFGNYYFKSGHADFLRTNARMQKVTEELLKFSSDFGVDRAGYAHLPYKATVDGMKAAMGNTFEADQLFRLEQKGLFMKRTTTNDGGMLSFYKADYEQMLLNWKILRELELWNEKGFVEMDGITGAPAAPGTPDGERKRWAQILADWKPATLNGVIQLRTGAKKAGEIWCPVCMSVVKKGQQICEVCGCELKGKALV